jgi:hypothetical protein
MSRLMPYLCLGSTEIANLARVTTYGRGEFFDGGCDCPVLDLETYVSPEADPAPWYTADHPESADFLGFLPQSMTLSPPGGSSSTPVGNLGSFIGPEGLPGRILDVTGWLVARDSQSIWYGKQWLTEALRGSVCEGCAGDTVQVLPFCRDGEDLTDDFRTMVNAKKVGSGPQWVEVSDDPTYVILSGQFQLASRMPFLYHPAVRCIDEEVLMGAETCSLTTPGWTEEGTFVIDITNTGTNDVLDITITGQISLDGSCPVDPPGDSVPPSFAYTIPVLAPEDRIVIDGTRRQALYYDASAKTASSALPYMEWSGPFSWPDVGVCTTMCLSIEETGSGSGDGVVTVDSYLREL